MEEPSRIFHNSELEEMDRQKKGNYNDKFGLMSGRVKPKIKEMLEKWFPRRNELKRLISSKRKKQKVTS